MAGRQPKVATCLPACPAISLLLVVVVVAACLTGDGWVMALSSYRCPMYLHEVAQEFGEAWGGGSHSMSEEQSVEVGRDWGLTD